MSTPGPLGHRAVPDVPVGATVVVPVGSLEQHGPHLPLDTDARVVTWVVDQVARQRPELVVAPPIAYGASGEHEGATGTISIGTHALTAVLLELGRSVTRWADRVVFANGHGGNLDALRAAVPRLRSEGRDVGWWTGEVAGDAHAGQVETSLLRHLDPHLVHDERVAVGDTRPLEQILPALRQHGVLAVSPSGVLGDPTTATARDGARIAAELVEQLLDALAAWRPDGSGRLLVPAWQLAPDA